MDKEKKENNIICNYCGTSEYIKDVNNLISCGYCEVVLSVKMMTSDQSKNEIDSENTNKINYNSSISKKINTETFSYAYSHIWQNVDKNIRRIKSLNVLHGDERELLCKNTTNILHHCNIIWSGWLNNQLAKNISIQLPKDCFLRVTATIIYVIQHISSILNKLNLSLVIEECFNLSKWKKKKNNFITGLYHFISIIQEYRLGGKYYERIKESFKTSKANDKIKDLNDPNFSVVEYYENIMKKFFCVNPEFKAQEEECLRAFKFAMFEVILEGKGPRLTMMVCLFYILKMKPYLNEQQGVVDNKNKQKKRVKELKKGKYSKDTKLDKIFNDNLTFFNQLNELFYFTVDQDIKTKERKKANFINSIQKYIKIVNQTL